MLEFSAEIACSTGDIAFSTIRLVGNANDKRVGLPLPDLCFDVFPVRLLIDGLQGNQWSCMPGIIAHEL